MVDVNPICQCYGSLSSRKCRRCFMTLATKCCDFSGFGCLFWWFCWLRLDTVGEQGLLFVVSSSAVVWKTKLGWRCKFDGSQLVSQTVNSLHLWKCLPFLRNISWWFCLRFFVSDSGRTFSIWKFCQCDSQFLNGEILRGACSTSSFALMATFLTFSSALTYKVSFIT